MPSPIFFTVAIIMWRRLSMSVDGAWQYVVMSLAHQDSSKGYVRLKYSIHAFFSFSYFYNCPFFMPVVYIITIVNKEIMEYWYFKNIFSMLQQLGLGQSLRFKFERLLIKYSKIWDFEVFNASSHLTLIFIFLILFNKFVSI